MKKLLATAAVIAAIYAPTHAQAVTANEQRGCELLSKAMGSDNPNAAAECPGMVATTKKADPMACVTGAMMMRAATEPVNRRPAGYTFMAMKACIMMVDNKDEAAIDAYFTKRCSESHDPQYLSECRGSGYLK
jgi:hypothetical protein